MASMLLSCGLCATLSAQRVENSISKNWEFSKGSGKQTPAKFWQSINIPHSFNAKDGQDGGGVRGGRTGFYRGNVWYRKNLEMPSFDASKRYFINFEAVSIEAEVFLNGKKLGKHRGAFTAFNFEVTDVIKPGNNLLEVKVNNHWKKDMPPLSGDFVMFGGIYRPVQLISTSDSNISPLFFASKGVFLTQKYDAKTKKATVDVKVKLSNKKGSQLNNQVKISVIDANNKVVCEKTEDVKLTSGKEIDFNTQIALDNPTLWNGTKNPYVYDVKVELLNNNKVIDCVTEPLGIRNYYIDGKKGFFLNGKHYQLKGVNRHQDRLDKGWAISEADHEEDMKIIREMGANSLRLAHYPQSKYFYGLADKEGMVTIAEVPLVDQVRNNEEFKKNSVFMLKELIYQNYNHPAICFWSISNEIGNQPTEDGVDLMNRMYKTAKELDSNRPVVLAANKIFKKENLEVDHVMFNNYPGWYGSDPSAMGGVIDKWYKKYGKDGIGIAEYGAGASIYQHASTKPNKQPSPGGNWHPEEWQTYCHENHYRAIADRPYVWGSYIWNMFDFASVWRTEGDHEGRNDKGLVTYDRQTKKDVFYFYKANWSDKPVVYINQRRFVNRKGLIHDVKVFSNNGETKLFVNGKLMGSKTPDKVKVVLWKDIKFKPGNNTVTVEANGIKDEITFFCDNTAK